MDSPEGSAEASDIDRSAAARLMGQARTPAKQAAARENGKDGGWPKGRPRSTATRLKISTSQRDRAAFRRIEELRKRISR